MSYPPALQAVVDELGRFPGVGPKSAQRIAFWLMRQPSEDVDRLANSLGEMKVKLSFCERCCNIARRRSPSHLQCSNRSSPGKSSSDGSNLPAAPAQ